MKVPGIIYSLLLAVVAWAVEYFSSGPGSTMSYAPIIIAVVPVLLKLVTVTTTTPAPVQPVSQARGMGDALEVARPSKIERFLLG